MQKSITLEISSNALQAHLNHGDYGGKCSLTDTETTDNKDAEENWETAGERDEEEKVSDQNRENSSQSGDNDQSGSQVPDEPVNQETRPDDSGIIVVDDSRVDKDKKSGSQTGTVQNPGGSQDERETTSRSLVVYGTVKARVNIFRKTVSSHGILDFKIFDAYTNQVLTQEKFPGEFVWYTEWAYFNGDERALNEYQKEIVSQREVPAPPLQDLFVAFTEPIYIQLTEKVKAFYRRY